MAPLLCNSWPMSMDSRDNGYIKYWDLKMLQDKDEKRKIELVADSVPLGDVYRRLGLLGMEIDQIVAIEGASDDIRTIQIYRRVA